MTRTVEDITSFGSVVGHACAVPDSDEHLWEMSSAFIAAGLDRGEQVSYFDDGTSDHVLERLLDDGVSVTGPLESGQLVVVPSELTRAALLRPLDALRDFLDVRFATAVDDGWNGMRLTGQLNHGLTRDNGVSMPEYDVMLDDAVRGRPVSALCFYDRAHYPEAVIELMREAHEVEIGSPPVYDDNLLRITATGPGCARVAGELDHSNRPQVRRLLLAELDLALRNHSAPTDIRLDVTSLRFVDVAGAVGLVHAAEEFPSTHRLVLHGVRPRVARVLDRCGAPFAQQLVVEPRIAVPVPRPPAPGEQV